MTVAELIKRLSMFDGKEQVVLAKDREGNDYGPLDEIDDCFYTPETTWFGEIGYEGEEEEYGVYKTEKSVDAVVLWPVN